MKTQFGEKEKELQTGKGKGMSAKFLQSYMYVAQKGRWHKQIKETDCRILNPIFRKKVTENFSNLQRVANRHTSHSLSHVVP